MDPIERLTVDGRAADVATFVVPDMSLSSARADAVPHLFEIVVNVAAMIDYLSPEYEKLVAELRRDDDMVGRPQDALGIAGYPSLRAVAGDPELSLDVLGAYLLHEFLGRLSWDGSATATYWLDRIDRCDVEVSTIRLIGRCYSKAT